MDKELNRMSFIIMNQMLKAQATDFMHSLSCEEIRQQIKIESVAKKCKGTIPMCAYEAMLNWNVRLAMCV